MAEVENAESPTENVVLEDDGSSQTLSEPSSPVTKTDAETVVKAATAANTVKKRRSRTMGLYMPAMITQRIPLSIIYVGNNVKQALEKKISNEIEGKCIV